MFSSYSGAPKRSKEGNNWPISTYLGIQGRTKVSLLTSYSFLLKYWCDGDQASFAKAILDWIRHLIIYLIVANMYPNIPKTMPQRPSSSLLDFLIYNSCHPFAPASPPCPLSCWHSYFLVSTQNNTFNACIMNIILNIIRTVEKND